MVPSRRTRARVGGAASPRRVVPGVFVAFLLIGLLFPSGAYSLVEAARSGVVGVTGDQSAELGLTVYSCVDKDNVDPLVDVTNNFEESLSVTVSLVDGGLGTLHADGQSGDSVTFALGIGATTTVYFETTTGGPWPKTLDFDINAGGSVTSVTAARTSQIDRNCGGGGPPGG